MPSLPSSAARGEVRPSIALCICHRSLRRWTRYIAFYARGGSGGSGFPGGLGGMLGTLAAIWNAFHCLAKPPPDGSAVARDRDGLRNLRRGR
jgi:hypothetical protein